MIWRVILYFQFFFGWWLAIDAAACYTDKKQLMDVFHICGVFATISMFMINGVSSASLENPDAYTDGCLGVRGARIWFFFGCLMGFGSLIGASYILFGEYIALCKASTYVSKNSMCSAWTPYSIVRNKLGPTFINFGFFPGPTALLKALCLLNFGIFTRVYRNFQV